MLKKKCPHCEKKIERKFNFCPYCGFPFKKISEQEDFGILGREDSIQTNDMQMPLGLNKIMNSLMKQLDKELGNLNNLNIQISMPGHQQQNQNQVKQEAIHEIDSKEQERRITLPREEAESNVRRFADKLVYEINLPGVKNKKDVSISKLENGIEVKAYSKDKCYVKTIPVKTNQIKTILKDNTLFLEFND